MPPELWNHEYASKYSCTPKKEKERKEEEREKVDCFDFILLFWNILNCKSLVFEQ
jgi:hypothetical protein